MDRLSGEVQVYDTRLAAGFFSLFLLLPTFAAWRSGTSAWPWLLAAQIFPLLLYWRLRLDAEGGVIRILWVIPVSRIVWREVAQYEVRWQRYLDFRLTSGLRRSWDIGGFRLKDRQAILEFLQKHCPPVEPTPPSPEAWLRETLRRRRRNDRIAMAVWILLLGGLGAWQLADALIWDARVRNWRQVPGVILKNDREKVRSGRSTKTVSRIEYEYRFEGRRYTGSRILYGGDFFPPAIKPGAPRKILVDPAAPARSAAMLYYRGHWGLLRYGGPAANFAGLAVVLAVFAVGIRRRDRFRIPEKLRAYAAAHPAAVPAPPFRLVWRSIDRPPEPVDGGILRARDSWLGWAVLTALLVGGALAAAVFCRNPLLYLLAVTFLAVFWLARPGSLTLDPRRRRLTAGGFLRRERETSLADVQMLSLSLTGSRYRLDAFRRDGTCIRLFRVPEKSLPQLLDLLPELAEQLGGIPVGFSPRPY